MVPDTSQPGDQPTLQILGEIGPDLLPTVQQFLRVNANAPGVRVEIRSDGGDAATGLSVHEALRAFPGQMTTFAAGTVASAAAIIFLAGSRREMEADAELMLHNSYILVSGQCVLLEQELARMTKDVFQANRRMERIVVSQTGQPLEQVVAWLTAETFFDAEQAQRFGLATDIIRQPSASAGPDGPQPETPQAAALALIAKYTAAFGEKAAAKYLGKGLSYPQALERHCKVLKAEIRSVSAELTAARAELEQLQAEKRLLEMHLSPTARFDRPAQPQTLTDVIKIQRGEKLAL